MSDTKRKDTTLKIFVRPNNAMSSTKLKREIVQQLETFLASLLSDLVQKGSAKVDCVIAQKWANCYLSGEKILKCLPIFDMENNGVFREINYRRISSKHRFALFLYILADAHKNLIYGEKVTIRELYYGNIALTVSQNHVNSVLRDVSYRFKKASWELGIMSSGKGLVAGALTFVMTNGDLIDCGSRNGATLIPSDFERIDQIKTSANFVLLVEKDTVFQKFITDPIFCSFADKVVLVTGKGFPDIATRILINRLYFECSLPIYALVDADPFGIEILLVYKHGSCALAQIGQHLACPKIQWIGIHPSEIILLNLCTEPLTQRDNKKVFELLKREYVDKSCRQELKILKDLQRKAEVENATLLTLSFLLEDYIPNKIRRQLVL